MHCVKGPEQSHVLTQSEIPKVWPILIGTNLTCNEVIELENIGFCLQSSVYIFPWWLLSSRLRFEHVMWTHPRPTHAKRIHSLWNGKQVCRSCKIPTENHRNRWESARNVTEFITGMHLLPLYPGLGTIITLSSKTACNEKKS